MNDTIHSAEEFHNFPFEKVSKDTKMSMWTWGTGGHGLPEGTNVLTIIKPEEKQSIPHGCDSDIWVLPEVFNIIIKNTFRHGKEEATNEVRNHVYGLANVLGFKIE